MYENIKETIDTELCSMKMSDTLKNTISENIFQKKTPRYYKIAAAVLTVLFLGSTTAFAGYYFSNKIQVNQEVLPPLDEMQIVKINELDCAADEYGMLEEDFTDYQALEDKLGISLLDTSLTADNPYMTGHIFSDGKDFCIVTIENYILGDTKNYHYLETENRYAYTQGTEYLSPISLKIEMVLSDEQLKNGWDTDFLGNYTFLENFKSEQGYLVNFIQSTTPAEGLPQESPSEDVPQDTLLEKTSKEILSEKCAVFVADGIRYTLKGRVSTDTMKEIINTMK